MFKELLEEIARALDESAIPYMVIGGQAVLVYGEPRLTKDIDVTLGADLERLQDVLAAARRAGLSPLVDPEEFTRQTMVLPCSHAATGIRVDLIFSNSPFERQAIARANRVKIGVTEVCFASADDLIIHKIIAGRPRDLEDVRCILLKNPAVDRKYVRRWLEEFSSALGEPFTAVFDQIAGEMQ